MKTNQDINRRSVMAAVATVPLAALPVMGGSAQSPVIALFVQWQAVNRAAHGVSEAECEKACGQMGAIEAEMMPLPITDISDLAAKLIVHTADFGLAGSREHAPEFQRQVRTFVGGTNT